MQHSHLVVVGLAAAPTGRAARDTRVDDHVMIARLVIAHVCEYVQPPFAPPITAAKDRQQHEKHKPTIFTGALSQAR